MRITENVLVAFEANHIIYTRVPGNRTSMDLKLDISKAYDIMEWIFLRKMLLRLGFANFFVDSVMLYVTSISYSFILRALLIFVSG